MSIVMTICGAAAGIDAPPSFSTTHHAQPRPAQAVAVTSDADTPVTAMREVGVCESGIARQMYQADSEMGPIASPSGTPKSAASTPGTPRSAYDRRLSARPTAPHAPRNN